MTKILLADDSVTIQKVVELTFSEEAGQVVAVSDGAAALEKAQLDRPDIILSDVIMPGMNGYELCQRIKSDSNLKSIPFLFLKGTFESFDEDKARQCGADGFIVKPFESQELIGKVRELVARSAGAESPAAPIIEQQVAPPAAAAPPPAPSPPVAPPPAAAPPSEDLAALAEPSEDVSFDLGPELAAEEPAAPAQAEAAEPAVEEELFAEASSTGEEQEEDLWSEVSLRDTSAPLVEDHVLEDESFWGTGTEEAVPAPSAKAEMPSGEDLIEEVDDAEILDLGDEIEAPVTAAAEVEEMAFVEPVAPEPLAAAAPVEFSSADVAPPPRPPSVVPEPSKGPALSEVELENAVGARLEEAVRKYLGPAIDEAARKIIEEVAWEVIPDLAEAMIRSEIEKVKKKG